MLQGASSMGVGAGDQAVQVELLLTIKIEDTSGNRL